MEIKDDHEEFESLYNAIIENPYNYEGYLSYIQACKNLNEVEKLREAMEKFALHFPLTEGIYIYMYYDIY